MPRRGRDRGSLCTGAGRGRSRRWRRARLSGLGAERGCDKRYPGSAIDWLRHRFGTAAFVVEFGPGRLSDGQVERHARATVRLIKSMR